MVADLINAKGGAKMYTIKGTFGSRVYVTQLDHELVLCRRPRIHKRRAYHCLGLQPSFFSVYFAFAGSAI
jgi:hypothetical protein